MEDALPALGKLTQTWIDFFIMTGAFLLVAGGALIWVFFLRKPKKRRRKRKHRHHRHSPNPTLNQGEGLPPVRPQEKPYRPPSSTPPL
jgi:hypothetical protein